MATVAAPAGEAPAGGTSYGTPKYRFYVLLMLTLVYTLNFIDRNLLNVIGPDIIAHFHLNDTTYGFLNGPPFAIFYAVMGIPIAMMADRLNRVVVVALAISVWSVMAAMCGLANSFIFLLFCRIGVAIGEAGGTPPSNSLIGDYFKPKSRANALGIFSMGVTIGSALSNFFGGPISQNLKGPNLKKFFEANNWDWALGLTNWDQVEGWRVAFVLTGAPGILMAVILLLTVREPPRGYSDPPNSKKAERASMLDVLKEIGPKITFWTAAIAASLTALVGYGLTGFQAAFGGRVHLISPSDFAWYFGGPLALFSAVGTFGGGLLVDRISHKWQNAVAWVPGIGLLVAIPLYIWAWHMPTAQVWIPNPQTCSDLALTLEQCKAAIAQATATAAGAPLPLGTPTLVNHGGTPQLALFIWGIGAMFHYAYLGSQYTIAQGLVGQRGRASAVAILLLMVALIGNGLGPQIVGLISDMQMQSLISGDPVGHDLKAEQCRLFITGKPNFTPGWEALRDSLSPAQRALCVDKYGAGVRDAMTYTALLFILASGFFFWAAVTLKKDMVAKPV